MPWFDHNATAPLAPEARAAWLAAADAHWQNPSSPVAAGARAHAALEDSRALVARLLDEPEREVVIFNSGATEGNNAVIAAEARRSPAGRMLLGPTEHPSVAAPARRLFGDRLTVLPADARGRADLFALEGELKKGGVTLVSLMAANNETGVVQPWIQAARLAASHGARFHCDATQWFGRMPLHGLATLDYVTAGGHKFGAPRGVGLALVRRCNRDWLGQEGGGQEGGRRAGTENQPGIAGFAAALAAVSRELMPRLHERLAWRAAFEESMLCGVAGCRVNGAEAERLWNTVSLTLPRHAATRWIARLDRRGFQVSSGAACSVASAAPSPALLASGLSADEARRTVRVSAGRDTTADDWLGLADAFSAAAEELDADAASSSVITV